MMETKKIAGIQLNLTVNVAKLDLDSSNQLTADGRRKLETTIVHEMMHAFMDDTLTNGMIGADKGVLDASNQFPLWFVEGMAQTVAGGCSNDNDWVSNGLGITMASSDAQISAAISANKLASTQTAAVNYGTGYLACMYLGQLASGTTAVNAANLRNGVNKIMEKLIAGSSLNDVIKDVSGGTYGDIAQFQNRFGSDNASITFIKDLVAAAGSTGNGAILVDPADVGANKGLANHDLLDNSAGTTSNSGGYAVNTGVEFVTSSANTTRNWNTGGAKSGSTGGTTGGGGTGIGGGGGGTGTGGGGGTGGTGGVGGTGGGGNVIFVQVGADSGQHISVAIDDCHAKAIGLVDISVMSREEAGDAIDKVKAAIQKISENRSRIGAGVNRLEHTIKNLDNITENTQAAESAIRDTDVAEEMVRFSNANILEQAGASVLSQANQSNSLMLSLLQ